MDRGMNSAIIIETYKTLVQHDVSNEKLKSVYLFGWVIEMGASAVNIMDDIVDQPELRSGNPCWHALPDVGLAALNHAYFIIAILPKIVNMYVSDKSDLLSKHTMNILYHSVIGQILDEHWKSELKKDMHNISIDSYNSIIYHKITVAMTELIYCAMVLANKQDNVNLRDHTSINDIAQLYQISNDYKDCYGDPKQTGSNGVDIRAGVLTWMLIKALQKCSVEEYKILQSNYGRFDNENVEAVMNLYAVLNIKEECLITRDQYGEKILVWLETIDDVPLRQSLKNMTKAVLKSFV